jgi:membrane-associated phospholipid phosphatase
MDDTVLARGGDPPEPPGMPPPPTHLPMPPSPAPSPAGQPDVAAGMPAFRTDRWRSPWLLSGGLLLILALLTLDVLSNGPLVSLDWRIRDVVQAHATSARWLWLTHGPIEPAQRIVELGNNQVAIPVLAVCALAVVARRQTLRPLLAAGVAVAALLVTVIPAKILIARSGPGLGPVTSGAMGVFPSGHTATSSVCYGLAVLLLLPVLPARLRAPAVAGTAAVCLAVGVALVWCDYHWFTDVLAGWALSGIIIQVALRLAQPPAPGPGRSRNDHGTPPG